MTLLKATNLNAQVPTERELADLNSFKSAQQSIKVLKETKLKKNKIK